MSAALAPGVLATSLLATNSSLIVGSEDQGVLTIPFGSPQTEPALSHSNKSAELAKVRQLFVKISLLWALVSLINAAATITLLLNVPIATYLAAKTGVSCSLTLGGILLSSWWFRRSLRRHGGDLPDLSDEQPASAQLAQVALAGAAA